MALMRGSACPLATCWNVCLARASSIWGGPWGVSMRLNSTTNCMARYSCLRFLSGWNRPSLRRGRGCLNGTNVPASRAGGWRRPEAVAQGERAPVDDEQGARGDGQPQGDPVAEDDVRHEQDGARHGRGEEAQAGQGVAAGHLDDALPLAPPEEDAVPGHGGDQEDGGRGGEHDGDEVDAALHDGRLPEPRGERDREEEREQDLDPSLGHTQLLQDLLQVANEPPPLGFAGLRLPPTHGGHGAPTRGAVGQGGPAAVRRPVWGSESNPGRTLAA